MYYIYLHRHLLDGCVLNPIPLTGASTQSLIFFDVIQIPTQINVNKANVNNLHNKVMR